MAIVIIKLLTHLYPTKKCIRNQKHGWRAMQWTARKYTMSYNQFSVMCANTSKTCLVLLFSLFISKWAVAQPANDNWANAIEVAIPDDNIGTGTFTGTQVSLNAASNQTGEYLFDPTYPKTVWYKFTIPTHRLVRIKVLQPTPEVMNASDAGFVVYNQTTAIPGAADLAIFTPLLSFASYSENICLEPGEYYIQAMARNTANGNIFVEVNVNFTYPASTIYAADQNENKHNLGTVTFSNNYQFNWDCLSLESSDEYSNVIGADSLRFNKSIWFKFDTDDHIDLFSYSLYEYSQNGWLYAIRIYEGDIDIDDIATQTPYYESTNNIIYSGQPTYLPCFLKPDTIYTVQILGHEDYSGNCRFYIYHLGEGVVTGAYPQETTWNPLNDFGTITPTPAPGDTQELFDYFSCEALLTNDSIQCGTANPPDSVNYNPLIYDLTTWFTLSTTAESNANFRVRTRRTPTCNYDIYNHQMRIRVWYRDPDNDCLNYNYPDDLYYDGVLNANGLVILNCLPAGDFAIQLLGRSQLDTDVFNCQASQFGSRITLAATLSAVPPLEYGLASPGDLDWINAGTALQTTIEYVADTARFSCTKTIMPDTAICDTVVDRAIYRQLLIGDSDGDALPDSGTLVIDNYAYFNPLLNQRVRSAFYKGDADALAQAQSIATWPDEIQNLEPYEGCNMFNTFIYSGNTPHNRKKYCVTPGTYTLASVGDSTDNGAPSAPKFTFTKSLNSLFADYQAPEDMGDVIAQGLTVTSQTDYYTCLDNPDTVGGLAPCSGYTKQLYREFYLSQDCRITVNDVTAWPYNTYMRLYQGRASEVGLDSVSIAPFHTGGCYSGHGSSYYALPACTTVPAGWYTVVSYGFGPNYENNYDFKEEHGYVWPYSEPDNVHFPSTVTVVADTSELPGPFFNRPHKACQAPDTISYQNTGTTDYPSAFSSYTLCTERFKFVTDTPFVDIPILGCANTERLAFYVFTTDEEYYFRATGVANFYKELYPLDVTTSDSLLLPTTSPVALCDGFNNDIEACRLQPGTYTLVVYGTSAQFCNVTLTPTLHVAPVDVSRFDFAAHAYDFDLIPPDNTFHGGKVGDVHPDNPALLPSDDTFYCTTGAAPTDPPVGCYNSYYAAIYPDTLNNTYHNELGSQPDGKTRNLWYTFVVQGMGTATVRIRNHTGTGQPYFRVYRSDVDGFLGFDDVLATGEVDSTLTLGLEAVTQNWYSCSNSSEASFTWLPDVCVEDTVKRRYYVLATLGEAYQKPNIQMDLQVKWNPIYANPIDPVYDFFYQANVVGNGEIAPPYTELPLQTDTLYSGGWGNMSCATGDTTDQALFGACALTNQKSLWWKFTIDEPGFLYAGTETIGGSYSYWQNIALLEEIDPTDSIISPNGVNGLLNLGYGNGGGPGNGVPNYNWRRYCLEPGTYYQHVRACAVVDTTQVRAHFYFTPIPGDRCIDAVGTTANTFGVYPVSVPILCHSNGSDFGEDGSNLNCLQGPDGFNSTWFKFSYTGPDLVDVLFQLNLNQLNYFGGPQNVRYRLFYGDDCSTMIEGQECSNNALINNSVACISEAEGDFYVQVTYPENCTGTLGFTFTVSANTNPDCNPFNPTILTSDFISQMNCEGDSIIFTNYGTAGSSLEYLWEFGSNNATSTEVNPIFAYPADGDYDVTLYVINPILGDTVSNTITVTFDTSGSPLELGPDQTICQGASTTIGGFISQATYVWSAGQNTAEIDISTPGQYWVDIMLNGCAYFDSLNVEVIDLNFDLGPDAQICQGDTLEIMYTSPYSANYDWSNGSAQPYASMTNAGDYWLELSFGNCTATDTFTLSVLDLSFDLGNDTTICAGTSFDLIPTVSPGASFDWSTNQSGPQIQISNADTYALEIALDGCTAIDSLEVSVLDLELNLGTDTILCLGDTAWLTPQTNVSVNYLWDDGSTASTYPAFTNGWVSLQVDSAACFTTDSILVSILDLTFDLPDDTTICAGASLIINPSTPPGVSFLWSTAETTPSILVDDPGTYSLLIDSLHCSAEADMNVAVLDLSFTLGNDTTICDGANLPLAPEVADGVNYLWSDATTGPGISVDSAGTYALTIDSVGCSANDNIQVEIFYVDPAVSSNLTTCLNDTLLLNITGADSLAWNNGANDITAISSLQYLVHPQTSATYSWTAFENGCAQDGTTSVEIIQPYIPSPLFDNQYCLNETNIEFPDIPFTTGEFVFEGNTVSELLIYPLGTGNFNLTYQYLDTNACAWSIDLPFGIVDTTTISWTSPFPEICVDAAPLNLQTYASHTGVIFSFQYQSGGDTLMGMADFDPAAISPQPTQPSDFIVGMSYLNTENCLSDIAQLLTVHPIPVAAFTAIDVCVFDTTTFVNASTVAGSTMESYLWDIPGFTELTDEIPQDIALQVSGNFPISLTATSDIGCSNTFTDTITIYALPVITFDPYDPACLNDGDLTLPVASPAGGAFWLDEDQITGINSYIYGAGTFDLTYAYTDLLGCSNASEITLLINDTTTTSLALPETLCADASPLSIVDYASHAPGTFTFSYAQTGSDTTAATFDPALIIGFDGQPWPVTVFYTHQNAVGCISTASDTLVVHPLPEVDYVPNNACINDTVSITNNSTSVGSTIDIFLWQFQNWGDTNAQVPTDVVYGTSGIFQVSLTATTAIGCSQTQTQDLEIYDLPNLQAENYGPFCHNDDDISLPVVTPAGGDYLFLNQFTAGLNTYSLGPGDAEIVYQYTDSNTCFNQISVPFTVNDTTAITFAPGLPDLCIDTPPLDLQAQVNFPGGTFQFAYNLAGPDTILADAFDPSSITGEWEQVNTHWLLYSYTNADACTSHIAGELTIHPLPVIDFEVNNACIYDTLTLVNNSSVVGSGIASYEWDFMDNSTSSLQLPGGIVYNASGSFNAILALTSQIGCTALDTAFFEIFDLPVLSVEPYGPFCLNDGDVPFPDISPSGGDFYNANGTIGSINTYNFDTGENAITYAYTDTNTCYNELEISFVINDTTAIAFTQPFAPVCIDGEPIALEPYLSIEGGITSAAYELGVWTNTNTVQPSSIQNFAGIPTAIPVRYEYTNSENCTSVIVQPQIVHPLPVLVFDVPDICQNEALQVFNNSYANGSAITSFTWTISGLDTFNTFQLPPIWFDMATENTFTAHAISTIGCESSAEGSFFVHPVPQSSFTFSGNCDNVPVEFTAVSTIETGLVESYIWWMDGLPFPGEETFSFLFEDWGTHTTALSSVSEFGCRDTIAQNIYIDPSPFGEIYAENHCFNTPVFVQSNVGIESGSIELMAWNSGQELALTNVSQFEHTFQTPGDRNIWLQLMSDQGCITVLQHHILVHALPQPAFLMSEPAVCQGDTIEFIDVSTVPYPQSIDMVLWDLSNGASFTDSPAVVATTAPGIYDMQMLVVSDSGCVATLDTTAVLQVWPNPRAQFALDPASPGVGNPEVQIVDQSQGDVVAWHYDMGDENEYELAEPFHRYTDADTFNIVQTVTNVYGCTDTALRIAVVGGFLVFIPNAFTPTQDGINDLFKPSIYGEDVANYNFRIWDRWGNEVFSTTNPDQGWDGSHQSGDYYSEAHVYTYHILIGGRTTEIQEYTGMVTLIR